MTADKARSALCDHVNRPYSICKHPDESKAPDKHYATVVSVIMDLHAGTMEISDGNPCENRYQKVKLKGYNPNMSGRAQADTQ
jgi:isopenicillin-N N-acyltransferase-like protein